MSKRRRLILLSVVVLLALGALVVLGADRGSWWPGERKTTIALPYSVFLDRLEAGRIASVELGEETISGTFTEPIDGAPRFTTKRVSGDLVPRLEEAEIEYTGKVDRRGFWEQALGWVLPILLVIGAWWLLFRRIMARSEEESGPRPMKIGKSNARIYFERDTGVRFRDVAGIEQAQAELQELVNYLDHPQRYGRLGASIPKGVLLVGPPGTGKTLMARAVAGEAGVPFFSITGSEFVEMFVGVGAARVRDLFQQARQQAPAIIFVDELDAFARARGTSGPSAGGDDERENTLNQLLSELDGFDPAEALVLLAATNRPELLDAALLRAGRFDRRILLDRPDRKGRAKILMLNLEKITPAADVEADELARLTTGFTGADLTNLVNEAALLATRRDADAVYRDDFLRAMERIIAGLEKKNRLMNEHERTIVAHHELGHALIAMALGSSPVHKVSIIPRGIGALGWTMQRPTEDRYLMTRPELENKIAVMLGGRAAEELSFGEISTGAADDIERATQTARAMITQYGMDSELGYVAYDKVPGAPDEGVDDPEGRPIAEATQEAIDRATRDLVHALYERAYRILENNAEVLRRTAAELLEQETLQADDLRELTRDLRCEEPKDRPRV